MASAGTLVASVPTFAFALKVADGSSVFVRSEDVEDLLPFDEFDAGTTWLPPPPPPLQAARAVTIESAAARRAMVMN
jgi:hypothetical protein